MKAAPPMPAAATRWRRLHQPCRPRASPATTASDVAQARRRARGSGQASNTSGECGPRSAAGRCRRPLPDLLSISLRASRIPVLPTLFFGFTSAAARVPSGSVRSPSKVCSTILPSSFRCSTGGGWSKWSQPGHWPTRCRRSGARAGSRRELAVPSMVHHGGMRRLGSGGAQDPSPPSARYRQAPSAALPSCSRERRHGGRGQPVRLEFLRQRSPRNGTVNGNLLAHGKPLSGTQTAVLRGAPRSYRIRCQRDGHEAEAYPR